MEEKIFNHFQKMIEATMVTGEAHTEAMAGAAEKVASALLAGNTIFTLGEKSGVLLAQLFSDYLALGYDIDRPGFPSINLNQITQNSSDAERYDQALNTHGKRWRYSDFGQRRQQRTTADDALNTAVNRGMTIVLLSAANDDSLIPRVSYNDIHIAVQIFLRRWQPNPNLQVIQCICGLIDSHIFGGE